MKREELNQILENHKHWINRDCDGWKNMRAVLCRADLRRADLYGANLCGANLYGAILYGANLYEANICGAKNVPHIPLSCPSDGTFIGWKKAKCENGDIIVKLEIPEDAKRSSATGYKCRCDKAKVLGFYDMDRKAVSSDMEVWSRYDKEFKYRIGEIVAVSNFDDERYHECAPGIHFFIDREEAIKYM